MWLFRGDQARRPGDPRRHQRPGQPRGDGRGHRRPPAADVAHRARAVDRGRVDRRRTTAAPSSTASTTPTARGPGKYGQHAYVRQFDGEVTRAMEDELLRVIAEYNGRPFPEAARSGPALARRAASAGRPPARRCTAPSCWRSRSAAWACSTPSRPSNWYDPGKLLERRPPPARRRRQPRRARSP